MKLKSLVAAVVSAAALGLGAAGSANANTVLNLSGAGGTVDFLFTETSPFVGGGSTFSAGAGITSVQLWRDAAVDTVAATFLTGLAGTYYYLPNATYAAGDYFVRVVSGTPFIGTFSSVTTPVPEPESYALMLAGLGALGFLVRRRRTS